ncbi:thioredoxin domain [Lactobacillus phage CL1]|uniref:Ribonucleoside-diphosphate reductase n=1 Tax=Lactobacillus phage CL1 TaxID=1739607 RepID=A0A0P0IJG8_9CAUD|nr:thioredoxin domain [Lactobacillus phage CL1]ALJ97772.1 ribonucleoside-diphosphate reductase [Lactobacillus phage CL1]
MTRVWNTDYGNLYDVEHRIIEELSREEKHMQAIIYIKPHCPKCWRTAYKLKQVMPVSTITADEADYERFRKMGYGSMPVVTIYKANGVHDRWCDLQVDKIKQYTEG